MQCGFTKISQLLAGSSNYRYHGRNTCRPAPKDAPNVMYNSDAMTDPQIFSNLANDIKHDLDMSLNSRFSSENISSRMRKLNEEDYSERK